MLLLFIGDKAPPTARDISEVALALSCCCCCCHSHTGNGGLSYSVFEVEPILVGRIAHLARSHEYCSLRTTGDSLLCERYLLAPLTGTKEGNMRPRVLRARPTPTRFPTKPSLHPGHLPIALQITVLLCIWKLPQPRS